MAMTEDEIIVHLLAMGVQQYAAGMDEAAVATTGLERSTRAAGTEMSLTARRGFLMNQTLFTMRRLVYGLSLAVIAGGAEVLKWGFSFNDTMASARTALRPLIPDANALTGTLGQLFKIAQFSPFTFQDTTLAFRNMFVGMSTLGISAQTVLTTINSVVNALAVSGRTTPSNLNRVAYALQHVAYQGKLTGQAVNQLGRDGIPVAAILRKEFGLTGDQIHNIAAQGIPTIAFLQAFNKYISENPVFQGAAERQSMRTFSGLFAQFKDNMSRIMGAVETGFFNRTITLGQRLNKFFSNAGAAATGPGATVTSVLTALFPAGAPLFNQLTADLHMLWTDLVLIITALAKSHVLWTGLFIALGALHGFLYIINPLLQGMGGFLNILIPLWVVYKGVTMLAAIATGVNTFAELASKTALKDLTFAQFLYNLYTGEYLILSRLATAATWLYTAAVYGLYAAQFLLGKGLIWLRTQLAILNVVLELNPIILIVTAAIALVAGLVVLYFKWKAFHDLVNNTFIWVKDHWRYLLLFLGPFGLAIDAGVMLFNKLWNKMKTIFSWIKSAVGYVKSAWNFFFGSSNGGIQPTSSSFNAASGFGNNVALTGVSPLMNVTPMAPTANNFVNKLTLEPQAPVVLEVDGRKMAQNVAKWRIKTQGQASGAK